MTEPWIVEECQCQTNESTMEHRGIMSRLGPFLRWLSKQHMAHIPQKEGWYDAHAEWSIKVQNLKIKSRALNFDVSIRLTTSRSDLTHRATFYLGSLSLKEGSETIRSGDNLLLENYWSLTLYLYEAGECFTNASKRVWWVGRERATTQFDEMTSQTCLIGILGSLQCCAGAPALTVLTGFYTNNFGKLVPKLWHRNIPCPWSTVPIYIKPQGSYTNNFGKLDPKLWLHLKFDAWPQLTEYSRYPANISDHRNWPSVSPSI